MCHLQRINWGGGGNDLFKEFSLVLSSHISHFSVPFYHAAFKRPSFSDNQPQITFVVNWLQWSCIEFTQVSRSHTFCSSKFCRVWNKLTRVNSMLNPSITMELKLPQQTKFGGDIGITIIFILHKPISSWSINKIVI